MVHKRTWFVIKQTLYGYILLLNNKTVWLNVIDIIALHILWNDDLQIAMCGMCMYSDTFIVNSD